MVWKMRHVDILFSKTDEVEKLNILVLGLFIFALCIDLILDDIFLF